MFLQPVLPGDKTIIHNGLPGADPISNSVGIPVIILIPSRKWVFHMLET